MLHGKGVWHSATDEETSDLFFTRTAVRNKRFFTSSGQGRLGKSTIRG